MDRYCPKGNHMRPRSDFRARSDGVLERNCIACQAKRRPPSRDFLAVREEQRQDDARRFPGVDIDRIHHKIGAVKK